MHLPWTKSIIAVTLAVASCGNISELPPGSDGGPPDTSHETGPSVDGSTSDMRPPGDGPVVCPPGFASCDNDPTTCEADLSQPEHCTACARRCAEPTPLCTPTGCAGGC